jgi:hypothetical protein
LLHCPLFIAPFDIVDSAFSFAQVAYRLKGHKPADDKNSIIKLRTIIAKDNAKHKKGSWPIA